MRTSPGSTEEVVITTGMNLVRSAARILRSTQKPSIRGMWRSRSTRPGFSLWGGFSGVKQVFFRLHAVADDYDFVCHPISVQQAGLGQLCEVSVVVHQQNAFVRHGDGLRVSGAVSPLSAQRLPSALLVET